MPEKSLIGKRIGEYRIVSLLGEGGMGVVYRAIKTGFEKSYAIKFISDERLRRGSAADRKIVEERFEREVQKLITLDHPNIVGIEDIGVYRGRPFMVMQYVAGGSLKEYLKSNRLTWQQAAHLLIQIANALDYAHREAVIHRDIKPSNILLTTAVAPMLVDFGVAKAAGFGAEASLTMVGSLVGTMAYMAPEQLDNRPTPQVDIYALGTIFYEMVTGQQPYPVRDGENPVAVLVRKSTIPPKPPTEIVPNLPVEVEKVILRMLAPNPAQRYPSMAAVLQAMGSLLFTLAGEDGIVSLPPIIVPNQDVTTDAPATGSTTPRTKPTATNWRNKRNQSATVTRLLAWGGTLLVALILIGTLAGGGYWLSQNAADSNSAGAADPTATHTMPPVSATQFAATDTLAPPSATTIEEVVGVTATNLPADVQTETAQPTNTPTPTDTAAVTSTSTLAPPATSMPANTIPEPPTSIALTRFITLRSSSHSKGYEFEVTGLIPGETYYAFPRSQFSGTPETRGGGHYVTADSEGRIIGYTEEALDNIYCSSGGLQTSIVRLRLYRFTGGPGELIKEWNIEMENQWCQ